MQNQAWGPPPRYPFLNNQSNHFEGSLAKVHPTVPLLGKCPNSLTGKCQVYHLPEKP